MTAGGSVTESESTYGGFITSSYLLMTLTDDHIDGKIKCEVGTDGQITLYNLESLLSFGNERNYESIPITRLIITLQIKVSLIQLILTYNTLQSLQVFQVIRKKSL